MVTMDPSSLSMGGDVSAGFEPVRRVFTEGLGAFGDGGGAFAAYIDGQAVVDLWGGRFEPGVPWHRDAMAVVMSTTKGLATLCAQILVERGELDVDAPVAQYWPEFAQAGKGGVLVRHVLTHTSGVIGFDAQPPQMRWDGSGWDDYDAIAEALAASRPSWVPGSKFGYHALTYGWLIGELVRRITGSTVGTFFHREVAEPLGLSTFIGTPAADRARVAPIVNHLTTGLPIAVRVLLRRPFRLLHDPASLLGRAFMADGIGNALEHAEELFNGVNARSAEFPAGGGTTTARSLARLYAMLALNGEIDGVRILSEDSVQEFAQERIRMSDALLIQASLPGLRRLLAPPVRRTFGYLMNPTVLGSAPTFGPNPDAFGHDGAGGQIAFCDRENKVAVGFIRSELGQSTKFSTRLIGALYECAGLVAGRTAKGVPA